MSFDEDRLTRELQRLSRRLRSAFAASVAERLLPAYERLESAAKPDVGGALAELWEELERHEASHYGVERQIDAAPSVRASAAGKCSESSAPLRLESFCSAPPRLCG